jgi:hypothetical protein
MSFRGWATRIGLALGCASGGSGCPTSRPFDGGDSDIDADVDTDSDGDTGADADTDADTDTCPADQADCGGECVWLSSDPDNCGACGSACPTPPDPTGWSCLDGECSCATHGEVELCAGTPESTCCNDRDGLGCFDLTAATDHCGDCTTTCDRPGVSSRCAGGACACGALAAACEGSLESTCCLEDGGHCANLLSDETDCGSCGLACPSDALAPTGDRCRSGQCVCGAGTPEVPPIACPAGEVCCAGGCVPAGACG